MRIARLYFYQGQTHLALNQYPQAKALFQKALAIQMKKPGPEHKHTKETQFQLNSLNQ
jgi:tetratricopeptide (TPR) repeat protein